MLVELKHLNLIGAHWVARLLRRTLAHFPAPRTGTAVVPCNGTPSTVVFASPRHRPIFVTGYGRRHCCRRRRHRCPLTSVAARRRRCWHRRIRRRCATSEACTTTAAVDGTVVVLVVEVGNVVAVACVAAIRRRRERGRQYPPPNVPRTRRRRPGVGARSVRVRTTAGEYRCCRGPGRPSLSGPRTSTAWNIRAKSVRTAIGWRRRRRRQPGRYRCRCGRRCRRRISLGRRRRRRRPTTRTRKTRRKAVGYNDGRRLRRADVVSGARRRFSTLSDCHRTDTIFDRSGPVDPPVFPLAVSCRTYATNVASDDFGRRHRLGRRSGTTRTPSVD